MMKFDTSVELVNLTTKGIVGLVVSLVLTMMVALVLFEHANPILGSIHTLTEHVSHYAMAGIITTVTLAILYLCD